MSMKVDLRNMLRNAAECCTDQPYQFMLHHVGNHLDDLAAGKGTLEEFCDLYCITVGKPAVAKSENPDTDDRKVCPSCNAVFWGPRCVCCGTLNKENDTQPKPPMKIGQRVQYNQPASDHHKQWGTVESFDGKAYTVLMDYKPNDMPLRCTAPRDKFVTTG